MSISPVPTIQEVRIPISRGRLLELAIARLQNEKARIDSELQELQAELKGGSAGSQKKPRKRTRRNMTAQERKAASARMKKYWAERKKKEAAQKG